MSDQNVDEGRKRVLLIAAAFWRQESWLSMTAWLQREFRRQ